jgi:transcriptional regulator with XRE-family HTH domain
MQCRLLYALLEIYSMTTFATNLRRLRLKAGMTQFELGDKSGLGSATVSHYECGQREPNLANLRALQEALECGYPAFFTNKQKK